jgi:hypothetical protein
MDNLTLGFVAKEPRRRYFQCLGNVKQPFIEQASSAKFHIDQYVARDAGP